MSVHAFFRLVSSCFIYAMQHFILDAHNILHKHPVWRRFIEQQRLAEARQGLVNAIAQLAERYPAQFYSVVFDGVNTRVRAPYRNIAIYEAPRGTTADTIIKQRVDADPNPRACVIVSSDTEVHNYARRSGCAVMSADSFLQELQKPHYDKSSEEFAQIKSHAAEKPLRTSKAELNEFKQLFLSDLSNLSDLSDTPDKLRDEKSQRAGKEKKDKRGK
jgi:predicted RNA-binding protein with PIN domain